jgi:hypothetical protein
LEAHGGYLFRSNDIDAERLVALARDALVLDEAPTDDCSLQISGLARLSIVRVAFDAPFTYGRGGAHWYERNHSFARLLSNALTLTVHAYVLDPSELEQVTTYAKGQQVGGERIVYDEVELDDEDLHDDGAYDRIKDKWPIGHLARVYGARRGDLVRLPRMRSMLLHLDGSRPEMSVAELFQQRTG